VPFSCLSHSTFYNHQLPAHRGAAVEGAAPYNYGAVTPNFTHFNLPQNEYPHLDACDKLHSNFRYYRRYYAWDQPVLQTLARQACTPLALLSPFNATPQAGARIFLDGFKNKKHEGENICGISGVAMNTGADES